MAKVKQDFKVTVYYDDDLSDPESIAFALDDLIEVGVTTSGMSEDLEEDYGCAELDFDDFKPLNTPEEA